MFVHSHSPTIAHAIMNNDIEAARKFLEDGEDPNTYDSSTRSPLLFFARNREMVFLFFWSLVRIQI